MHEKGAKVSYCKLVSCHGVSSDIARAYHGDRVTGGEGKHVGAGDGVGAGGLHGGLGAPHRVEAFERQGLVVGGVLLGLVARRRLDQHRAVATLRA
jgi:hypothetical protein